MKKITTSNGMGFSLNLEHLKQHPDVMDLLPEALELFSQQRHPDEPQFVAHHVDLGRIVGEQTCVPTAPGDDVFYARRQGRKWDTRFVNGKAPIPSSCVTIAVRRVGYKGEYRVLTAYIGQHSPREVDDHSLVWAFDGERLESVRFWSTHALVAGTQILE